jgi:hypothetical protein
MYIDLRGASWGSRISRKGENFPRFDRLKLEGLEKGVGGKDTQAMCLKRGRQVGALAAVYTVRRGAVNHGAFQFCRLLLLLIYLCTLSVSAYRVLVYW